MNKQITTFLFLLHVKYCIASSQEAFGRGRPTLACHRPPRVDHPMADICLRNTYDVGYPKGLKNGKFRFFDKYPQRPGHFR